MKMKKMLAMLFVCVMACGMLAGCGSESGTGLTVKEGKLMVAAEIGYPPMEYYDEDGSTPIGFDMEFSKLLAEQMGLEIEIVDTAWDGIFAGVDTRKYDCVISAVSYLEDRAEKYHLTAPYIANAPVIVVPKGSEIADVKDLDGKIVAVQMETTADYLIQNKIKEGLKTDLRQYEKVINAFDELKAGRVDAVCTDSVVAAFYLGDDAEDYQTVWQSETREPIVIAMKKGNTELIAEVNKAVAALFESGKMKELSEKYFGEDLTEGLAEGFTAE